MTRLRFSIAGLMALVLLVAVGFAALRNANYFWACATFTLAVITVATAIIGAVTRSGAARLPWLGFVALGLPSLILWLSTHAVVDNFEGPPGLLVFWGLSELQPTVNPSASFGRKLVVYNQVCDALQVLVLGLVGVALAQLVGTKHERSNP